MKINMAFFAALTIAVISFSGCKKDKQLNPASNVDSKTALNSFHSRNSVPLEHFTFNASTGGTFTSSKGTKITVPANCFVNGNNSAITGNVTIGFKDIYKKSDMLFSNVSTNFFNGTPLVSGGEFFININGQDSLIFIAQSKNIDIEQPAQAVDNNMQPMVIPKKDTIPGVANVPNGWVISGSDAISFSPSSYVFSLYEFNTPASAGTWCNSDNPTYFSAFTQTSLSIVNNESYAIEVFLVFKNENSMVHVYYSGDTWHNNYDYAPVGKECTVVAMGYDTDGKLKACFKPITITDNSTVSLDFSTISEDDFKTKVKALD